MAITKADEGKLVAYEPNGEGSEEVAYWGVAHAVRGLWVEIRHSETGAFEGEALASLCRVLPDQEQ